MRQIYLVHFIKLMEQVVDLEALYYVVPPEEGQPPAYPDISDADKNDVRATLLEASTWLLELGLPVASAKFKMAANDLPQTQREFRTLVGEVRSEAMSKLVLMLPSDRAAYFDRREVLTTRARGAFPTAYQEVLQACRAYSLGMETACVFHCMRALEPVLGVLAADVGESVGVDTWQTVIERIESAITTAGKTLPRGIAKQERLQFLAAAAKEFAHFKDGWRNHVSHGRGNYTAYEARRVIGHVCAFIEHLSSRLHE